MCADSRTTLRTQREGGCGQANHRGLGRHQTYRHLALGLQVFVFPSATCMFAVDPASSSDLNSSTSFHTQPPPGEGAPEHHPEIPSLSRFGRVFKSRIKCGRMGVICIVWFVVYSQSHLGVEFCQMPCRHLWIWSCDFPFSSVNMIDFLY